MKLVAVWLTFANVEKVVLNWGIKVTLLSFKAVWKFWRSSSICLFFSGRLFDSLRYHKKKEEEINGGCRIADTNEKVVIESVTKENWRYETSKGINQ